MKMKSITLLAALLLASASATALAPDCPNLMRKIDEIMAGKPDLDEETLVDEESDKSVRLLREEGEALHDAGDHDEAVNLLNKALELLEKET